MQLSLRDIFSLTFLIAIALFGIQSLYTRSSLESQSISREAELNGLENRVKMDLLRAKINQKLSAALDRSKTPLVEAFATVHPRDEATLSILQVPTYSSSSNRNPVRFRLYVPNSQPVYLKFGAVPIEFDKNQPQSTVPNMVAVGVLESGAISQYGLVNGLGTVDHYDEPTRIGRIDADPSLSTHPEFKWLTADNFLDREEAPTQTGPYAMDLPAGICNIELRTTFPTLHILVNGKTKLNCNLLPNSNAYSGSSQFKTARTQQDYPLDSPMPALARAQFERGFEYELWLSTQPCDFATFPEAGDDY
ncbi:MAG: hypothetical protein R3C53_14525 [Pirellulaceae bacterium]